MRKIFTFLCAALMSVGMFALTPKGTDVWDDATKTLTVNGNPVSNAYIGVSDIENLVISDAVTSIGDNAFENCNGLKSVAFGSSLASIGKEAFASCSKLESVTLPASLESIGKSAFYTCGNLTEVTIPDGVTSIGQQAFYFCEKLTSVTIPNSVASIGGQAFLRCGGLTGIVVAAENPNYSSEDGVLFNKDKTTLIQYPGGKQGEYTIPNSVTSIGRLAFSMCSLLTSVEIPNSVEEIVDYAFQSCSGLTSVTIGNGVTSIGGYAFYYSSKLASVTINATTPPTLGGSALDKTAAALTIYVPAASVTDYKGAWTAYADKIVAAAEPEPLFDLRYENKWLRVTPKELGVNYFVFVEDKEYYDNRYIQYDQTTMQNYLDYVVGVVVGMGATSSFVYNGDLNLNPDPIYHTWYDNDHMIVNHDYVAFVFKFENDARVGDVEYLAFTYAGEPEQEEGIENIVLTEKAQKVIVDGMVYIVRDGKLFNLTGAEVK